MRDWILETVETQFYINYMVESSRQHCDVGIIFIDSSEKLLSWCASNLSSNSLCSMVSMYPEPEHFSIVTLLVKPTTGAHLEHSSILLPLPLPHIVY